MKSNALQELRAVLFIMVLAFHCHLPNIEFFWAGVEVFFFLSGFFIFKKLLEHKEKSLKDMVIGRIKRLYTPLYIFAYVSMNIVLMSLMGEFVLRKLLYYVFCLQNYGAYDLLLDDNSVNIHTWTVAVEVQMIIIICLITFIFDKLKLKREAVVYSLAAISIAYGFVSYFVLHNYAMYSESFVAHAFCFALGGFSYMRTRDNKKVSEDVGMLVLGIVLMVYVLFRMSGVLDCTMLQALHKMDSSNVHLEYGLFMILIYPALAIIGSGIAGLLMRVPNEKCHLKPLISMGDHSYSLYIAHFPLVSGLFMVTSNVWIVFAGSFVMTVLMAYGYDWLYGTVKKRRR
ncbi:MAG: acyltransferase [Pseudobutyrivibrio sp.]|nr:acyltransferase [Pseudobutyrivibrio sp.]